MQSNVLKDKNKELLQSSPPHLNINVNNEISSLGILEILNNMQNLKDVLMCRGS